MKKIFILLTSMLLLTGCIESIAVMGGGAANGKLVQSSLQTVASYGVREKTGKTPFGHAVNYIQKNKAPENKESCSSFTDKQELEICLLIKKKIIAKQAKTEEELSNKPSKDFTLSLQSSINKKSKIKYLD
jgi:hypothetical protein